jgi:hypothetical protein
LRKVGFISATGAASARPGDFQSAESPLAQIVGSSTPRFARLVGTKLP